MVAIQDSEFTAVPVDGIPVPIPSPAQRRRGRPPMTDDEKREARNKRDREKRAGRPQTVTPRKRTTRGPRSLAPEISAFLTLANGILIVSPLGTRPVEAITNPTIEPTHLGDELDAVEIAALASAIDAEARRSPRFRRYVERVLGGASGGTLLTVLGLVGARRAARHGILPANVDLMAGVILSADVATLANMAPAPADPGSDGPDPETGETAPDRSA